MQAASSWFSYHAGNEWLKIVMMIDEQFFGKQAG
jgi:hypothetical protein